MISLDMNPSGTVARLSIGAGRGDATYRDINERGAARLAAAEALRGLRIEAAHMPRPRELLDLLQHLPSLRDASDRIRRVVVLSDSPPSDFLPVLRNWFSDCEVRHFSAAASRAADQWLDLVETTAVEAPSRSVVSEAEADIVLEDVADDVELADVQGDDAFVVDDGAIELDEADIGSDDEIDDWFVKS